MGILNYLLVMYLDRSIPKRIIWILLTLALMLAIVAYKRYDASRLLIEYGDRPMPGLMCALFPILSFYLVCELFFVAR